MDEKEIFGIALGLTGTPWEVVEVTLDLTRTPGRLDIRLDFPPGTRFPRPSDGQLCTIYDTEEHSWRHMNFFQYECYLHAWVPRIDGQAFIESRVFRESPGSPAFGQQFESDRPKPNLDGQSLGGYRTWTGFNAYAKPGTVRDPMVCCLSIAAILSLLLASSLPVQGALQPLRVSGNHRYLEDASGQPFFLVGDCPQNLPLKLAISEFDGYMAECASRGFNLLWTCIDGQRGGGGTTKAPIDRANHLMMRDGWDIGTLNDAYFVTINAILSQAQLHGVYCMLTPLSECQWTQGNINRNSENAWHNYGHYLGKRYRHQPNII